MAGRKLFIVSSINSGERIVKRMISIHLMRESGGAGLRKERAPRLRGGRKSNGRRGILLYNFEAAIFRSIGDTKVPLAALAISGVLNVLLNLFFVVVLHMTVGGVAIATAVSNAVSALLLYRRLTHTDKCVRVERKLLRIDGASLRRILSIGVPAGVQSAVFS